MIRKLTLKKEREHETNEASIAGNVMRDLIAHVTNDNLIGRKIKSGELRKKMVEPPWKCPDMFTMTTIEMEHFTMEWLELKENPNEQKVILQLHGGGYIGAMRNAYRMFAGLYNEVSKGMSVLTIDYRVAPENPYPAALEDAVSAYQWLLGQGWFAEDIMASGESYDTNYERDPLFGNTRDSLIYNKDYVGDHDPMDAYISPLYGDFRGFPPMLIQVGSYEMLLSDSVSVASKARHQGVKVRLSIYDGMFHIFQMAAKMLPESRKAWAEIGKFIDVLSND